MAGAITKAKYDSLRNSLKRMRDEGKLYAKKTTHTALTAGGGALSGVVRGTKFASIPNTEVPTDVAVGLVLAAVGIGMGNDDVGESVGALGNGMLAGGLSHELKQVMEERKRR